MRRFPRLHLPGVPTTGPTGQRDNIERLRTLNAAMLPPGVRVVMDVAHCVGCPCITDAPADACTCRTVDVTLQAHDPRES